MEIGSMWPRELFSWSAYSGIQVTNKGAKYHFIHARVPQTSSQQWYGIGPMGHPSGALAGVLIFWGIWDSRRCLCLGTLIKLLAQETPELEISKIRCLSLGVSYSWGLSSLFAKLVIMGKKGVFRWFWEVNSYSEWERSVHWPSAGTTKRWGFFPLV